VLVVAAGLSIQDPRERPPDQQAQADAHHARFADPTSDFVSWLNLWAYLREQQRDLSSSAFRRLCRAEHLHYLRVREWQDVHGQLRQVVAGLGLTVNSAADAGTPVDADRLHRSLLAGLLSHIGLRDVAARDYLGARGAHFAAWPGSALAKKPPTWVMAAELVETSRLWGRTLGRIDPEWAERLAPHLVRRTYSEPHWSSRQGSAMASEKVLLYGIPLVADRKVGYGRIDPEISRELFIRHALVEGDWRTSHRFFADNRALLEDAEELEQRARRRGLVVDDQVLYDFYDARIPSDVVSARHFDAWWKAARREQPDLLTFPKELLTTEDAEAVDIEDYPTSWRIGDLELPVTYQFEPGSAADGVTVDVPQAVLGRLPADAFDWQIPGLRHELVTALIRALPKAVRRTLIPAPDRAAQALQQIQPDDGPLFEVLGEALEGLTGTRVPPEDWDLTAVPDHLRVTIRVVDERGAVVGEGKDLGELQQRLRPVLQRALSAAAGGLEQRGLTSWTLKRLPETQLLDQGGHRVEGYPALVDEGSTVGVRVLSSAAEAEAAHRVGTRRLLRLQLPSPVPHVLSRLDNAAKLSLSRAAHASAVELLDDCTDAAVDALIAEAGGPARDPEAFSRLASAVRSRLDDETLALVRVVERVLAAAHAVQARISAERSLTVLPALADLRGQLAGLIYPRFVTDAGRDRLPDLLRYLDAMARRLDKLPDDPARDRALQARVERVQAMYEAARADVRPGRAPTAALTQVRWMIEELRVSLFAQTLRTAYPVSEQRIERALAVSRQR
jgi:ATP-dependent helicase HrpA